MTNADRIRQMTDEELAEFINGITVACSGGECSQCAMCNYKFDVCSEASILQKLKEEVEEDTLTAFCPNCGARMDGGAEHA